MSQNHDNVESGYTFDALANIEIKDTSSVTAMNFLQTVFIIKIVQ